MVDIQLEKALFEVYEIIKYINESSKEKIPENLIKYIENNRANNYNFILDTSKPIYEQELLPETEAFITLIYRDYICDKDKQTELDEIIKQNDLIYEMKLRKKYSPNEIFKNTQTITYNQNLPIKIEKENFLVK